MMQNEIFHFDFLSEKPKSFQTILYLHLSNAWHVDIRVTILDMCGGKTSRPQKEGTKEWSVLIHTPSPPPQPSPLSSASLSAICKISPTPVLSAKVSITIFLFLLSLGESS